MIVAELFPLPELHGRCGSAEALAAGRRLAGAVDREARALRIRAAEGLSSDGTASRWEMGFDLPARAGEVRVVVTFVWEESAAGWGGGVGSVEMVPFPPPGSELERMLVRGEIPRRRVPGLWRQQLAESRPLPVPMPTAAEALARADVPERDLRGMAAAVSRLGGPAWRITCRTGERTVRFATSGGAWRFVG